MTKRGGHCATKGPCGSCWAFSAVGALEGQMKRRTGSLVPLSPLNLLDCSVSLGNRGCRGGYLSRAFLYIIQNNGIDSNTLYPYEHKLLQNGACRYSVTGRAGYCSGFRILPRHNEAALQYALANIGPVSVGVNAKLASFHRYRGGETYIIHHTHLSICFQSPQMIHTCVQESTAI
ncbi:cathepsin K-like [Sinocyclocheilus anshuiensis]|uniref:cathepsin K-like n=1 Tax=Sinocyclocheilus anshuiensis TaxID=1608454 RepID=UPI0007BA8095|nr:PREDICTED: cathepsin K-like [Sinocyclocheilus anshuiensis]